MLAQRFYLSKMKIEGSSIELLAEFIEIELPEFCLYTMVNVQDISFSIVDSKINPPEDIVSLTLFFHDDQFLQAYQFMLFKDGIRSGHIDNHPVLLCGLCAITSYRLVMLAT